MTTHDQRIETETAQPVNLETTSATSEMPTKKGEQSMPVADPAPTGQPEVPAHTEGSELAPEPESEAVPRSADVQPSQDDMLFAGDPSNLRSRWDDIQAAFVDDPSGCVRQADGLVEEVIEQLTSRFADARSQLEAQWARGESASTEDLRVALTRYREFFQRLLAV
jgi:hypothetical protein